MHGGKDFHGMIARVDALEFLVNLQDPAQLAVQFATWNMRQIQVHALLARLNAQALVHADVENLARRNVSRHQIAVFRITFLQEVVPLGVRNLPRVARILRSSRHPDPPSFAPRRFAHQPQLVRAGDRRRMNLDELAITVFRACLEATADRTAGADHGHRTAAKNHTAATGGHDNGIGGKRTDLHRNQVLSDAAAADAVVVEHRGEEVPELELPNLALRFPATHLFVQRVQQLLSRRRSGKCSAFE